MSDNCENNCQKIACIAPNDFSYSLEVAPSPPPTPEPKPYSNNEVYYLLHCADGEIGFFSGTLPAWITLDSENGQLIGLAGTYRGVTKDEANTLALQAITEFGNEHVADGSLRCVACVPSPIPYQAVPGNITSAVPAPNRAGSYAQIIPFTATAGDTINIYTRSQDLAVYLMLVDPLGNVVEQFSAQSGPFSPDTDFYNAFLQYTFLDSGDYTIEVSTIDPATEGTFTAYISSGRIQTINSPHAGIQSDNQPLVYVPSTGYMFVGFNHVADDGKLVIYNPVDYSIINTIGFGATRSIRAICYSPVQDLIYALVDDAGGPGFSYGIIKVLPDGSGTTGGETIIIPHGGVNANMIYDSVNDRLVAVVDTSFLAPTGVQVLDCATLSSLFTTDAFGTDARGTPMYNPALNYYYFNDDSSLVVRRIDAATLTVISNASFSASSSVVKSMFYIPDVGIVNNDGNIYNPSTEALIGSLEQLGSFTGFSSCLYDPCNDCITLSNGDTTLVSFDPDTFLCINDYCDTESAYGFTGLAIAPSTSKLWFYNGQEGNIQVFP